MEYVQLSSSSLYLLFLFRVSSMPFLPTNGDRKAGPHLGGRQAGREEHCWELVCLCSGVWPPAIASTTPNLMAALRCGVATGGAELLEEPGARRAIGG